MNLKQTIKKMTPIVIGAYLVVGAAKISNFLECSVVGGTLFEKKG